MANITTTVLFTSISESRCPVNKKTAVFWATWFRTGLIPPVFGSGMAGTYGSFFSLPLCFIAVWLAREYHPVTYFIFVFIIYWLGAESIETAEKALGSLTDYKGRTKDRDQNQIVIDETFGMLITCWPLAYIPEASYWWLGVAFLLFRFFDIVKIWPANYFDQIKSFAGVMLDDAVAAVYAATLLTFIVLKLYALVVFVVIICLAAWFEEYTKKRKLKGGLVPLSQLLKSPIFSAKNRRP